MTADLSMTNVWLGVMAVASVAGIGAAVVAMWMALRVHRQFLSSLTDLQRDQIEPLVADLRALTRDVHDMTNRLQRLDDEARRALTAAEGFGKALLANVREPMVTVVSMVRGFTAALAVVVERFKRGDDAAVDGFETTPGGSHVRH
jgi:hypothetical protein